MTEDEIGYTIVGAAMCIQNELGPGLLENIYKHVLAYELRSRGLKVDVEVAIPVTYKNHTFDMGYRADLIVEDSVIVELKTVENLTPIHEAQIITYLKLSDIKLGYLINFNSTSMISNKTYKRFINTK